MKTRFGALLLALSATVLLGAACTSPPTPGPDTKPPALTLPGDISVQAATSSGATVEYDVQGVDQVDGPVPVTCAPASGSVFPVGITSVTCSATDSAGNVASGSFSVVVTPLPDPPVEWLARSTAASPSARNGVAMVYDTARQRTVLYGGWNHLTGTSSSDTWEYDGTNWVRTGVTGPVSSNGFSMMAYDAGRARVVLLTGSQTWEYDGSSWTRRTPVTSPPSRRAGAMTYDASRQRVVLFGGLGGGLGHFADTWEWDGTNWSNKTPAISPPRRSYHAMAYDSLRQRTVLFGGDDLINGAGAIYNDTWEWDGTAWSQRTSATSPPINDGHNMVYDSARQRTVLFVTGGETWEWNGLDWTKRQPPTTPPVRAWFGMAYDSSRSRTVVFGGYGYSDGYRRDTWELVASL